MSKDYIDDQGRRLFVADGISGGRTWATYWRKASGSLKRLKIKYLPLRLSREMAQMDLDKWAAKHRMKAAEE